MNDLLPAIFGAAPNRVQKSVSLNKQNTCCPHGGDERTQSTRSCLTNYMALSYLGVGILIDYAHGRATLSLAGTHPSEASLERPAPLRGPLHGDHAAHLLPVEAKS